MITMLILIILVSSLLRPRYYGFFGPRFYRRPMFFRPMMRGPRPMHGPHMGPRPMMGGPRRF